MFDFTFIGYSILLVDGFLPQCAADEVAQEVFMLAESMKDLGHNPQPSAPSMDNVHEDEELEMAIALSLSEVNPNTLLPHKLTNYRQTTNNRHRVLPTNKVVPLRDNLLHQMQCQLRLLNPASIRKNRKPKSCENAVKNF
jgi:hypothetical protein